MEETLIPDHIRDNHWFRYQQQIGRALEAVFIDEIETNYSDIFKQNVSKYDRLVAALSLVRQLTSHRFQQTIKRDHAYSSGKMPLDPKTYQLQQKIGSGGINDVFLLNATRDHVPSYVLKVNRASERVFTSEGLLKIAVREKREYEEIKSAFASFPDLIPPEFHFIIQGPRNGAPVFATLQPYLGKNLRDPFTSFSAEELETLLKSDGSLRTQLTDFIAAVQDHPSLIDQELDLLGKDNLAIVENKGENRLFLLDPHFRTIGIRSPETSKRIEDRLAYLNEISDRTQKSKE